MEDAQGNRGVDSAPGAAKFKAAVRKHIAHGVLQLGGHRHLIALLGGVGVAIDIVASVQGILGILGAALPVLDRDSVAKVIELQDLDIAVVISDGSLVMGIFQSQDTSQSGSVILADFRYPAGLAYRDGVVFIGQLVAVDVCRGYQQTAGVVAITAGLSILVRYRGQPGVGIAEGDIAQFGRSCTLEADAGQQIPGVCEGIYSSGSISDRRDQVFTGSRICNGDAAWGRLVVLLFGQTAIAVEEGFVAVLICDAIGSRTTAGGSQDQLQTVFVPKDACIICLKVMICAVGIHTWCTWKV